WYLRADMSHVIEVAFSEDPQAVVDRARGAAERNGAVFEGDRFAGKFSANGVAGHYRFTERVVVVTVESKPDFAPWPLVETAIRGFFETPPGSTRPASSTTKDGSARREGADTLIRHHVLLSSGAGLIPIPLADVAAVTAVQVRMLEELTQLYGARLT